MGLGAAMGKSKQTKITRKAEALSDKILITANLKGEQKRG